MSQLQTGNERILLNVLYKKKTAILMKNITDLDHNGLPGLEGGVGGHFFHTGQALPVSAISGSFTWEDVNGQKFSMSIDHGVVSAFGVV